VVGVPESLNVEAPSAALALSLVEHLLTVPGNVSDYVEANITLQELRLRWQWDPLRNDPRFQEIVAGPEPKTVYK